MIVSSSEETADPDWVRQPACDAATMTSSGRPANLGGRLWAVLIGSLVK
jgi:hypothetical protein